MQRITFMTISLLFLIAQCGPQRRVDFRAMVQNPNTVIIDVRTVEEFEAGHIPQSINVPLPEIEQAAERLRGYDNVILICRSGNRSGQAKTILQTIGLRNVYNGGGWEEFQREYLRE